MDNKRKDKYDSPELSVISFERDDVIATSGFFGEDDELLRSNSTNFLVF